MSMKLRRRSVFDKTNQRTGLMMTPMVDVVLVILIFFMASTTIAGQEWFLRASVDTETKEVAQEARFSLPVAMIEVDLVRGTDGVTMVYGIAGDSGVTVERAVEMIGEMELMDPAGSLKVGIGAGDLVPMKDVMAVHDAWHGMGVGVVMRTGG